MSPKPSLRMLKGSRLRGLVKMSAMLSSEETFSIEIFPFLNVVTKEMMTDFNMFGTSMLNWIFAKINGSFVITKNGDVVKLNFVVDKSLLHPKSLLTCLSGRNVLSFVVEIARAVCFLENHEVRQCPTKVQIPLVLFLST